MNAAALWGWLRGRGVDVWVQEGELRARTRDGSPVAAEDGSVARRHADALARYLRDRAGPSLRPPPGCPARPNLQDLARRHRRLFGIPITENYKLITGVDLETTNPDWEDLKKYDTWLRGEEAELLPVLEEFEEREGRGA